MARSHTTPQRQSRQKRTAYESDGDSDAAPPPAVPLQSLERGAVRDLVAEFQRDQALRTQQNKPTTKRARAELAQLEHAKKKRQFREMRAEKVVWRKFDRENRVFERYYQAQLPLVDWAPFAHALRTPPAVHVRVNGNFKSLSEIVTGTLELDFPLHGVLVKRALTSDGGDEHEAPVTLAPVDWAPQDKRTWKLSIDAKSLRKADALRELSTYVQTQVHLGTLQRLDPITAVVPDMLHVAPGQRILDLCGGGEQRAPAIVERLERDGQCGVLVVNEKDAEAAARASQTLSRTLALSKATVVTAHKPFEFPVPATDGFDRVVCSAPCSGDGLVRKIPERWRTWTPALGNKSHAAQTALAARAMALVRVGGALLYYTRSLNPIENEAVVASLLRTGDGAYELVDLSATCAALERSPGLSTWDVYDNDMQPVSLWETATPAQKKQLRASMWPPTDADAATHHLERCVRVLPHQNDTNAMFLALIRKVREPKTAVVAGPTPVDGAAAKAEKKQLKATRKVLGRLSTLSDAERRQLESFFGIPRDALAKDAIMERSGVAKDAAVHVVTSQVAQLLETDLPGRLAVHRAGVEAFKKLGAVFELTDDGARALLPVLRRRVLQLPLEEFSRLLAKKEAWLKHASEASREVLDETSEGSLVVVLDDMEPLQTADQDLVVVAVKRHSSYSVVSTPAAIARVKTLLKELEAGDGDDDSGYDSLEFED